MSLAYACKVVPENLSAIASEAGRKFDREFAESWLIEHAEGYFLRDDTSPFDCALMEPLVFGELYVFANKDVDALFREVKKR